MLPSQAVTPGHSNHTGSFICWHLLFTVSGQDCIKSKTKTSTLRVVSSLAASGLGQSWAGDREGHRVWGPGQPAGNCDARVSLRQIV